jgi:uncharacterized membrane protein YphA (DoxX/SURF4 family)
MKSKATIAARIVLGLVFFVFGLNKFLGFIPQPPPTGDAAVFFGGLMAAKYMFPLLALIEITAGALLLAGRFVPLALLLLAPIIVNIVGFHLFLAPSGLPVAIVVLAAEIFLAWAYRAAFRGVLRAREDVTPASGREAPGPSAVAAR